MTGNSNRLQRVWEAGRRLRQVRAVCETLEHRRLLSAAFAITGLTALRADPTFAGIDGSGVTVAVLDSGVVGSHPDLVGNFAGYVDAVRFRADRAPLVREAAASFDNDGHGTHVTGTIASTNPAIGVANAARFIAIRAIPADGEASQSHDPFIEGLRWILNNHRTHSIRVVNASMGTTGNVNAATDGEELRLIRALERQGITVVVANGNDYGDFRSAGVGPPANNATIGVLATWEDAGVGDSLPHGGNPIDRAPQPDQIVAFSQRGTQPNQVAAPGATIFSTWTGVDGQMYNTIEGTSMAAPFVAGVVALMQDAAHTFGGAFLTPSQVLSILRSTGDTIVDSNITTNGWFDDDGNELDLPETGLSFPRVNVHRAVEAVRAMFVRPAGDADHTLATAYAVPALAPGDAWRLDARSIGFDGTLEVGARDVDLYRIELRAAAEIDFVVAPVAGQPLGRFAVRVFAEDGVELGVITDESGFPDDGTVTLPAGVYFLSVSGEDNIAFDPSTGSGAVASFVGGYSLTVSADTRDPDGAIGGSTEIELLAITDFDDVEGSVFLTIPGVIGTDVTDSGIVSIGSGDVDFFVFFAPDTGFVEIELDDADSDLIPFLRVFDGDGNQIAFAGDATGETDVVVLLPVTRGEIYFIGVSSFEGRGYDPLVPAGGSAGPSATTGAYYLELEFDNLDEDGSAIWAEEIGIGSFSGVVGSDDGRIVGEDGSKDVDFYLVTAASSGLLTFALAGAFESVLGVFAYDAVDDDLLELGWSSGLNHRLQIMAEAGEEFWVAVTGVGNDDFDWFVVGSGSGGRTGSYTLTTSVGAATATDDAIAGARPIGAGGRATGVLGEDGTVLRRDVVNDVDLFRYTAGASGRMTVRVDGTGDFPPDVFLRVFDASGNELGFNNNAHASTTDAALSLVVSAGQTYFIGVSSFGTSPRGYNPVLGTGATGGRGAGDYVVRVTEQPMPTVAVTGGAADEGGTLTFTVTLSVAATTPVTVNFATRNGTALAGTHYRATSGTLTIPAGRTSATVVVTTLADGVVDGGRSFHLDLSSPEHAVLGAASATGTIRNVDRPPAGPDLTAELRTVPATLPPLGRRNRVDVLLANDGNATLRGNVRVELFVSADRELDSGDRLVASSVQRLNLRPDQTRVATMTFPSPADLPDGSYRIIAVVDGDDRIRELDERNNQVVSTGTVRVIQPFVDLETEIVSLPSVVPARGRVFATVRITNNGNVPAVGSAVSEMLMSRRGPGEDEGGVVGALTRRLNLRPGQSLTLRIPLRLPAGPETIYLGNTLSFTGPIADREDDNNEYFSSQPIRLN